MAGRHSSAGGGLIFLGTAVAVVAAALLPSAIAVYAVMALGFFVLWDIVLGR